MGYAFTRGFKVVNGVLTYSYEGSKDPNSDNNTSFLEGLILQEIIIAVAELNGYTREQFLSLDEDKVAAFTFDKNGFEMRTITITQPSDNDGITGVTTFSYIDFLKVNFNNFDLEITKEEIPELKNIPNI